jgi:hypothetical protein
MHAQEGSASRSCEIGAVAAAYSSSIGRRAKLPISLRLVAPKEDSMRFILMTPGLIVGRETGAA